MSQPGVYFSLVSREMVILALKDQLVSQRQPEMLHKPLPPIHSCNSSAALLHSESRLQSLNKRGAGGKEKNAYICFTLSLFLIPSFPTPPIVAQSQPRLPISPINHGLPSRCEQQDRATSHPGAGTEPVPADPLELGGCGKASCMGR